MAVFTLPPEMIVFYKKHIEFITDHAVDPDKRRYATKHEAVRHYIDLDVWGKPPFTDFPRTQLAAVTKYTDVFFINQKNDTIQMLGHELRVDEDENFVKYENEVTPTLVIEQQRLKDFFYNNVLTQYYEDEKIIECDSFQKYFGDKVELDNCRKIIGIDRFSEYGVLPFHLQRMQRRLTEAFKIGDVKSILRLSTELGHYVGDAHVPLHTTENYNGQLTNQNGIHAFWESRIPELFAEKEYDFFVGKATYVENKTDLFWDIILTSHSLVDSVLTIEKSLAHSFPKDKQFCFDERNERTVRIQCRAFAKAYSDRMKGMVEDRMTATVKVLGSLWYTAWVDAGQPNLSRLDSKDLAEQTKKQAEVLEEAVERGEPK
ncbi:MAG: zinc dependent phospholipase C family protein, partial [Bacteroidota bacterium]